MVKVNSPIHVKVRIADDFDIYLFFTQDMLLNLQSDEGYVTNVVILDANETETSIGFMTIPPFEIENEVDEGDPS